MNSNNDNNNPTEHQRGHVEGLLSLLISNDNHITVNINSNEEAHVTEITDGHACIHATSSSSNMPINPEQYQPETLPHIISFKGKVIEKVYIKFPSLVTESALNNLSLILKGKNIKFKVHKFTLGRQTKKQAKIIRFNLQKIRFNEGRGTSTEKTIRLQMEDKSIGEKLTYITKENDQNLKQQYDQYMKEQGEAILLKNVIHFTIDDEINNF